MHTERNPRLRVLLDADGVMADIHTEIINNLNIEKNTHFTINDITDWNTSRTKIGISIKEFLSYYRATWINDWDRIKPMLEPGMLRMLVQNHDCSIVTARDLDTLSPFRGWYLKNYKGIDCNVIANGTGVDKLVLPYDRFIEDDPNLAVKAQGEGRGRVIYLVDRPWNRNVENGNGILRVKDANEAVKLLLRHIELVPRSKSHNFQ